MNPLSAIFGLVAAARNAAYDRGRLRVEQLAGPVVSVGNLSVGGSGKTPFVIALGEWLQKHGIEYDILSRGYGRHTRGVLRVDPEGDARDFGDEPLMLARRLNVPVWVGERRAEAGRAAEAAYAPRLHLLDDGFQHRALARQFDIVLLAAEDLDADLLPTGRLREPLTSLARASAIVLDEHANAPAGFEAKIWRTRRSPFLAQNLPQRPLAFCGIARPERFFTQLGELGVRAAREVRFRDHHAYTAADLARLQRMALEYDADGLLTTEKDWVKLLPLVREQGPRIHVARLVTEVLQADAKFGAMLNTLRERAPGWNR